MAWCKRDVSDFFRWNFFSFKSAWIFACAFQLSSTTFPCIFLPGLHFVSEKNKDKILKCAQWTQQSRTRAFQSEKRYRRMFFYLIEKHMQKFRHFWRKKNFTWKSHLRPSCTKPFNYKWVFWKISTPTMGSMNINTFQPSEIPKCSSTCSPYPLQIPILLKIINPLFIFWFLFKPLGIPFRLPNLHFFPNPGIFCVLFSVKQTRNSSL